MAALSARQRAKLPDSQFVFKRTRRYPIPNIKQARLALVYGKRTLSKNSYAYLRAVIIKKFKSLKFAECAMWKKRTRYHVECESPKKPGKSSRRKAKKKIGVKRASSKKGKTSTGAQPIRIKKRSKVFRSPNLIEPAAPIYDTVESLPF